MNKLITPDHQSRARRVYSLRKLTRLSRRDFAKRFGIAAGTLQNWEDETGNGLSEKGAYRLVGVLQANGIFCSIEWLLYGSGNPPVVKDSAVQVNVATPEKALSVEQMNVTEEIELFCAHYPEAIYLQVKDDAMHPQYQMNDYIAGIRHYAESVKDFIGKDCIVLLSSGEQLVRRVRLSNIPGLYDLYAINSETKAAKPYHYEVNLIYIAPIIWHRRVTWG